MKKIIIISLAFIIANIYVFASTITFPVNNSSFTENGHSFTVTGAGYIWTSLVRSAPYCAISVNTNSDIIITKTAGNPFQLNHLQESLQKEK